ncbi:MAG: hypothetical protein N3A66_00995, partial [Planctomycetota bacterium]|nr:hypothetical protein [Planctomycetota bacterium]
PPVPRERDPRLSAATSQSILWLLEKDRDARPATPQAFLAQIERHPLWQEKNMVGGSAARTEMVADE